MGAQKDGVELAVYIDECVRDKNLSRAVRRVVSTGLAPATLATVELIDGRCPQQGAVDLSERASYLKNVS